MEYETFYDNVKNNNNILTITIPYKLARGMGIEKDDEVKVMIKKLSWKEEENES